MNPSADQRDLDLLRQENQKLQRKLERSNANRVRTEELKDRNDRLLNRVISELKGVRDELQRNNEALETANSQLRDEMQQRMTAEAERNALQADLVEIARRVGLEELTTNILHNVGNTLNSVNVSLSKIERQIIASKVNSIPQLASLLSQNEERLIDFIRNDPRGQKVPEYIRRLSELLEIEKREIETEIDVLRKSVDHINQIVSYQQAYSKLVEFRELLDVCELIRDALSITAGELDRFGIKAHCEFSVIPPMLVDRRKLIQIMLNLISNAKHAIVDRGEPNGWIRITTELAEGDILRLVVEDNGLGITKENMGRLFTFGFTTRDEGHGFGLHGCANHAHEMDGKIYAESQGLNAGARFVLELPIISEAEAKNLDSRPSLP